MPKLWHKKREEHFHVLLIFVSYNGFSIYNFYYTLFVWLLHSYYTLFALKNIKIHRILYFLQFYENSADPLFS
nr:MAG TPA: hypothetical protein [Bacteriophage sp.]